jgi:RNA polymerase sigma factor (sigma-70 family)
MSARDDLIQQNKGLAFKAAQRYYDIYPRDDLDQAAMLGLVKAARTYDLDHPPPFKFTTHARLCITRELVALVRGVRDGDGLPADVVDASKSVDARIEEAELYSSLGQALARLTPLEWALVVERFGLGDREPISRVELSMKTGVGIERIRAIERSATEKLRTYMDVDTEN